MPNASAARLRWCRCAGGPCTHPEPPYAATGPLPEQGHSAAESGQERGKNAPEVSGSVFNPCPNGLDALVDFYFFFLKTFSRVLHFFSGPSWQFCASPSPRRGGRAALEPRRAISPRIHALCLDSRACNKAQTLTPAFLGDGALIKSLAWGRYVCDFLPFPWCGAHMGPVPAVSCLTAQGLWGCSHI